MPALDLNANYDAFDFVLFSRTKNGAKILDKSQEETKAENKTSRKLLKKVKVLNSFEEDDDAKNVLLQTRFMLRPATRIQRQVSRMKLDEVDLHAFTTTGEQAKSNESPFNVKLKPRRSQKSESNGRQHETRPGYSLPRKRTENGDAILNGAGGLNEEEEREYEDNRSRKDAVLAKMMENGDCVCIGVCVCGQPYRFEEWTQSTPRPRSSKQRPKIISNVQVYEIEEISVHFRLVWPTLVVLEACDGRNCRFQHCPDNIQWD